jgi:hypothetical protein
VEVGWSFAVDGFVCHGQFMLGTNVFDECFQRMPAAFIVLTGVLHISLNLLYVKTQNDQ